MNYKKIKITILSICILFFFVSCNTKKNGITNGKNIISPEISGIVFTNKDTYESAKNKLLKKGFIIVTDNFEENDIFFGINDINRVLKNKPITNNDNTLLYALFIFSEDKPHYLQQIDAKLFPDQISSEDLLDLFNNIEGLTQTTFNERHQYKFSSTIDITNTWIDSKDNIIKMITQESSNTKNSSDNTDIELEFIFKEKLQ